MENIKPETPEEVVATQPETSTPVEAPKPEVKEEPVAAEPVVSEVPTQVESVTQARPVEPKEEPTPVIAEPAPVETTQQPGSSSGSVKSEPVEPAEVEVQLAVKPPAPKTPRTPRAKAAAAGTRDLRSFFSKTPKSQAKEVKREVPDYDLEVVGIVPPGPSTPKAPPRSSPRLNKSAAAKAVKKEPKTEVEDVAPVVETPAVKKRDLSTLKFAEIGYFASMEKMIETCKKFHGKHEIPVKNIKFSETYEEDDELIEETVEDIRNGDLTEANFTGITGMIAQKDYEKNRNNAEKWNVLILNNQHLILALKEIKSDSNCPEWAKETNLKITVELVGVPNSLFTLFSKDLNQHNLLEIKSAMGAVYFEQKKASEIQLIKALRSLSSGKQAESDKHWNSFIEQGVLQTKGSNLKFVFLMCTAPENLYTEFQKLITRNKKAGSAQQIVGAPLEALVSKCLESGSDLESLVMTLIGINSEEKILTPEQIVQIINAFEPSQPVTLHVAAPVASTSKAAPQKRKARESVSNARTQVKKERVEEDQVENTGSSSTGSDDPMDISDLPMDIKPEPRERDTSIEKEVKSEFDFTALGFDPANLPSHVSLIQTPLTCAVFTQVEQEKEESICIWTNDLDPDILTAAHLNSDKCIVLAEKVETFEDEEVIEIMSKCNVEIADFTFLKNDDNILQWTLMSFGGRPIPDGVKNKLFRSYRDIEKIIEAYFEKDKKKIASMVRFANDDLLPSLSKQLSSKLIGCNYIVD